MLTIFQVNDTTLSFMLTNLSPDTTFEVFPKSLVEQIRTLDLETQMASRLSCICGAATIT
jgi:hypothetical protein